MKNIRQWFAVFSAIVLLASGCGTKQGQVKAKIKKEELSIKVKNITQATVFTTCFVYIKKENAPRWRWDKSPVFKVENEQEITIPIAKLSHKRDLEHVYGALGVFNKREDADDAIYELLSDEHKVDLDRVHTINNKTVLLGVERYGNLYPSKIDYEFVEDHTQRGKAIANAEELDFFVENNMDRPVYVAGFIYQKKEDMPVWRFDKTPIVKIHPGELGKIDVDTLTVDYDRKYMRAYLGIFHENEKEEAENSTYQLLKPYQRVNLGPIGDLQDKKISLAVEQYGIMGNMIDFSIKEPHRITFGK